ncbi:hypothetical protein AWJ20_2661 [Sugiyamaella lignohabitans]|uniref:Uncharacterized protein n=1 Tax=Sugiyamaella lignohabitans TaxID=796027 RepID=A0A167FAP9_9ASCO|nr:uncharacterized protein AWJ20_2661 [Sugiyamaella lignohabitans]ANB15041.1 hypothetical protein AWJ20_2661 [Sugiyamaella lignohabitans]
MSSQSNVYFISGGNRGIGLALVKKFTAAGNSTVITTARNPDGSDDLKAWAEKHPNVKVLKYNATVHSDADHVASEVERLAGHIDIFIANSGLGETPMTVLETPIESWTELYNTNVLGPIVLFKALYPLLKKGNTRKVVFISSYLASQTDMAVAFKSSSYGQSKSALNFTAKELALELADEGFIIVPIHPGLVSSDMGTGYVNNLGSGDLVDQLKSTMISTEESASSIYNLAIGLKKEDSGKFLNYDKTVFPW